MRRIVLAFAAALLALPACAQPSLDAGVIGKPPTTAWPTYNGDYSGRHYSTLSQISAANVKGLAQAWTYRANVSAQGAQSGGSVDKAVPIVLGPGALAGGLVKATPLMVNGVLYFSSPDNAWAVDAVTGREIWHFNWRTAGGEYIGHRGMAMYKDTVYFGTPDGHIVALDAATGKERWHKAIGDFRQNYYLSAAPVVVKDTLIVGVSGDSLDVPGWVEARDPATGNIKWRWYTTPRKGEAGADTWPSDAARESGGGMTWQPVTYDPHLNLIYLAIGNPNPVYEPERRVGDNLYSCSVVAIDPDTGKMVWYFQTSRNEAWDFDSNQVPVLFDAAFKGRQRKLVSIATRGGAYFLLDRTTGENLVSAPLVESVNWITGFNAKGQPERDERKVLARGGALISPSNGGIQNWTPPAYDPKSGLLYVTAMQGFDIHYTYGEKDPETGGYGHQAQAVGGYDLSLRAIDTLTGKARWIHRYAGSEFNPPRPHLVGGLLATAGDLVFAGAPAGGPGGFMTAVDPANGRQLWRAVLPAPVSNTPITYELDGRQYLVFAANDTLYAYALPR